LELEVIASDMRILDSKGRGEPTELAADEHGAVDADQIPF